MDSTYLKVCERNIQYQKYIQNKSCQDKEMCTFCTSCSHRRDIPMEYCLESSKIELAFSSDPSSIKATLF